MKQMNLMYVNENDRETFSSFSDRHKHAKIMPSNSCLSAMHKIYYCVIKMHSKQNEKRTTTTFRFVSYKEANYSHECKGTSALKGCDGC